MLKADFGIDGCIVPHTTPKLESNIIIGSGLLVINLAMLFKERRRNLGSGFKSRWEALCAVEGDDSRGWVTCSMYQLLYIHTTVLLG
jgi:hypothetical protein